MCVGVLLFYVIIRAPKIVETTIAENRLCGRAPEIMFALAAMGGGGGGSRVRGVQAGESGENIAHLKAFMATMDPVVVPPEFPEPKARRPEPKVEVEEVKVEVEPMGEGRFQGTANIRRGQ